MDQESKEKLMSDIIEYGELCAQRKMALARKLYEKIKSETLTDREQFFKWMDEA